jgi:hypothetical protein
VVASPNRPGPDGAAATRINITHGKVERKRLYAFLKDALAAGPNWF